MTDGLWARFERWAKSLLNEAGAEPDVHTVRRTRQLEDSDCGIAALSMLANVPYAEARDALFKPDQVCDGTSYARLRAGMRKLGLAHGRFQKFRSWGAIPCHAVVHINWRSVKDHPGHWVVYQRYQGGFRILDPGQFALTLSSANTDDMIGVAFCRVEMALQRPPRAQPVFKARRPKSATPKPPKPKSPRRKT